MASMNKNKENLLSHSINTLSHCIEMNHRILSEGLRVCKTCTLWYRSPPLPTIYQPPDQICPFFGYYKNAQCYPNLAGCPVRAQNFSHLSGNYSNHLNVVHFYSDKSMYDQTWEPKYLHKCP